MSAAEQQDTAPDEGQTTIPIPDAEPANDNADVDVGAEPAAPAEGPVRQTRQERKEMRFRHLQEARQRAEDAERRFQESEERHRRMQAELAEMRGRQQAWEAQQRAAANQGDPHQRQIDEAHKLAWEKLQAAAASQDPNRSAEAMREYHQALTRASQIESQRQVRQALEEYQRSQPDPQLARQRVALESEFEWLATDSAARAYADGMIGFLTSKKGRPWTLATYREACAMAAKEFGYGGGASERPSEARRAAYNGVPGRQSAGADGDDDALQVPTSEVPKLKIMAQKARPDLEPDEAYKVWLRTTGRKMLFGAKKK